MMGFEAVLAQAFSDIKEQIKNELRKELMNEMHVKPDRTLNFVEACDYLHMSEYTLRQLCKQKKIPHRIHGSDGTKNPRYWFRTSQLDLWVMDQEKGNYNVN